MCHIAACRKYATAACQKYGVLDSVYIRIPRGKTVTARPTGRYSLLNMNFNGAASYGDMEHVSSGGSFV